MSSSFVGELPPSLPYVPLARHLDKLWQRGQRPDVHSLLAAAGNLSPDELASVLRVDQWRRWQAGEPAPVEEYLARYPSLQEYPEAIIELILSELLLRETAGETARAEDFLCRFPAYAHRLKDEIERRPALKSRDRTIHLEPTIRISGEAVLPPVGHGGPLPTVQGYELLQELGRGGMGIVYKARHLRLNRNVALKMVLVGDFARPDVLARFLAEAEIAARVQHPHVVQIHEVGDYNGLPYLALEYVDGGTLGGRLAGRPLRSRQAALLLETLAEAIHFAHQRGVIHRDLKPGNILLQKAALRIPKAKSKDSGFRMEDFEPKISDFGLAKLMDNDEQTTQTGMVMGTPAYMAPEQAEGKSQGIGPAADVYGLGAILYEALTARPPFCGVSPLDTLDLVRSTEPVPPNRLQPGLDRDVCVICLKCLAKDPSKRYDSAKALAQDLRRYLDGRPITARPTPLWERNWKWLKRRPVAAAASFLAVAALVALLGVWVSFTVRLGEQRNQALANAAEADRQRQRAEANQERTLEAVDRFLTRVGDKKLAPVPAMEEVRRDLLADALQFFQGFLREMDDADPQVRHEAARAEQRVARIYRLLGQRDRENQHWQEALLLQKRLAVEFPEQPSYRFDVSQTLHNLGLCNQAFARSAERQAEAERYLREALALRRQLVQEQPDNAEFQAGLARTYGALGLFCRKAANLQEQAEPAYRAALDLQQALVDRHQEVAEYQADLAGTCMNLGALEFMRGRYEPALVCWKRGQATFDRLSQADPENAGYQWSLAGLYGNLSVVYLEQGDPEQALSMCQKAVVIYERLVREHRSVPAYRQDLAGAENNRAHILERQGRADLQVAALVRARTLLQELIAEYPRLTDCPFELAKVGINLAAAYQQQGQHVEAREACQAAVELLERETRANAGRVDYLVELGHGYLTMGEVSLDSMDKATACLALNDKALAALRDVLDKSKGHKQAREFYGRTCFQRALLYLLCGKFAQAQSVWDQALRDGWIEHDFARAERALTYGLRGDHGQAVALLEGVKPAGNKEVNAAASAYVVAAEAASHDARLAGAEGGSSARALEDRAVALLVGCYPGSASQALVDRKDVLLGFVLSQVAQKAPFMYVKARAYARSADKAAEDQSLAADKRAELAGIYERRALEELDQAGAQGYFKAASTRQRLGTEPDLKRLQGRVELQKWLREGNKE
jgi:serine/threonine protein kinase